MHLVWLWYGNKFPLASAEEFFFSAFMGSVLMTVSFVQFCKKWQVQVSGMQSLYTFLNGHA